jgi:hypothetical protein
MSRLQPQRTNRLRLFPHACPIASEGLRVLEEVEVYAIPMAGCHSRADSPATCNLD